ncbi:pre-mRNA splicing factor SR-like 1 isoform X4 [Lolium perenne]|uniref:pre-mRNA splicing factor SR-like 1 isoform X4 n=1 Tax=Lolium perenne TaxID=4522 RepID=UPI0021F672CA|nr:pre-mRNA splicing factor SR-like 1 isoform X4 [Lolium perenne]
MEIQTSGKPIDMLMEKVLCMNIVSSDYFRELYRMKTYHEVIDEIYYHVDHVEPWMTGNCRGPSTAFCLLYKFFTMKLTVKQMHGLLKHPDSPYIRAIGFLYLRYVADPKILWTWYEPYLKDDEEFSPGSNGRMTTMGVYVRDLILGQLILQFSCEVDFYTTWDYFSMILWLQISLTRLFCSNGCEQCLILRLLSLSSETMPTNWTIFLVSTTSTVSFQEFLFQ